MTWVLLLWNLAILGLMASLLWSAYGPSPCDDIPYGIGYANEATACAMGEGLGRAVTLAIGMGLLAVLWPVGLVIIGIAWFRGRRTKLRERHDG